MTEPVTNGDIVPAARARSDCRHVLIGPWMDDCDREWLATMLTQDPRSENGCTWTMVAKGETREALLQEVRTALL